MERRIYSRAPITEAVIDLRFVAPLDGAETLPTSIARLLKDTYPNVKKQVENQFRMEFGESPTATAVAQEVGIRLTSTDGKYVLQLKPRAFTLSRLQPYERWEPFRDEARRLWGVLNSVSPAGTISRTAVRFINRIDLPGPWLEPSDYFTIYPKVPGGFDLSQLAMQIVSPQPMVDGQLIINQALIPPVINSGVLSFLLDLDLFSESPRQPDEGLWAHLERLHERKNEIFEAIITEKIREKIQ